MALFKKKKKEHFNQYRIVVSPDGTRFGQHGYTRLKDNLLYINSDGNHKVIQMESAMQHEGKTSVAANLGVSLGLTEKKVIIVDLDFRRPRLHRLFGMAKEGGIAEYVMGEIDKAALIKHTQYKNVDIITRGAEIFNPALVLVSEKFKDLIAELRKEYDFVLLDCAPVLQVSDYIHISKVSDGAIFLVAYAKTTRGQVAEAIQELRKNNVQVLGSAFTMYDRKRGIHYGYGYYGKYYDAVYAEDAVTAEKQKKAENKAK